MDRGEREGACWTPFARHVLAEMAAHYLPFLLGNAQALAPRDKSFVVDTYGEPAAYAAREYPERSRAMIRDRVAWRLTGSVRDETECWLEQAGLAAGFSSVAPVD